MLHVYVFVQVQIRIHAAAHHTRIAPKPPITNNISHAISAELPLAILRVAATDPSRSQPRPKVPVNADAATPIENRLNIIRKWLSAVYSVFLRASFCRP